MAVRTLALSQTRAVVAWTLLSLPSHFLSVLPCLFFPIVLSPPTSCILLHHQELQRYHVGLESDRSPIKTMAAAVVGDLERLLEKEPLLGAVLLQAVAGKDKHEVAERHGDPSLRPRLLRKQVKRNQRAYSGV